jgi:succinate dehydrogenase / fumarate reductase cytochrome b subunit
VSTATATKSSRGDLTLPAIGGRHHFLLRRMHSLTGIVFGGYLVVHLLINATIAQGGMVYQQQVDKIHSLPFLPVIEWTFIYLPIIYHTVYGVWITLTGQPNVNRYPYGKNWAYVAQRASAVVIFFFMLFHVLALKYGAFTHNLSFDPHRALGTVGRHFDESWLITWVLYPVGILASCFHLANGFWTAAITWGITISAESQRRWGLACAGLFVLLLIAGLAALVSGANLDWNDLMKTQAELGHGS